MIKKWLILLGMTLVLMSLSPVSAQTEKPAKPETRTESSAAGASSGDSAESAENKAADAGTADSTASDDTPATVDDIIADVEQQYSGSGFAARFEQQSTIKAMDITDTAEGKVFVKHPGMMRWEYQKPDSQIIITDGLDLWVFRPDDNQVMVGKAPSYFGKGKGASFLSNIGVIRDSFDVTLAEPDDPDHYRLKLTPKEKQLDLASIYLSIDRENSVVDTITTYNAYEDETLIQLKDYRFDQEIDDTVFSFEIPEDADIVQLQE